MSNLFDGFDEELIERLTLDTGQCHLFAVTLGELSGRDYEILIGIRAEYCHEDEIDLYSFSHAVVDIDGVDYDCRGPNAIDRWEGMWDDQASSESTFNWVCISGSPDINTVTETILAQGVGYVLPDPRTLESLKVLLHEKVRTKGLALK